MFYLNAQWISYMNLENYQRFKTEPCFNKHVCLEISHTHSQLSYYSFKTFSIHISIRENVHQLQFYLFSRIGAKMKQNILHRFLKMIMELLKNSLISFQCKIKMYRKKKRKLSTGNTKQILTLHSI